MAADLKELTTDIFNKGYLMSLATVDENGPWVSDVVYAADKDWTIYWQSHIETRHSKAINSNNAVAVSITLSNNPGEKNIGLQISGVASRVDDMPHDMIAKHAEKRKKPIPPNVAESLKTGQSWYRLEPTKIELIYEPLFGWDKQTIL